MFVGYLFVEWNGMFVCDGGRWGIVMGEMEVCDGKDGKGRRRRR